MNTYKLTNRDIVENFSEAQFYLMMTDFVGVFAKWVHIQGRFRCIIEKAKAIQAFENYLRDAIFCVGIKESHTQVKIMPYKKLMLIVNTQVFISIPEIMPLNRGEDFVDLEALARNVFFDICRNSIVSVDYISELKQDV